MARKTNAQAERERLEEELRTIGRARGEADRERAQLEREIEALDRQYRAALSDVTRGDEKASEAAERAREAIASATARAEAARDRVAAANAARRSTQRELNEHLRRHLDVFAREAEDLSKAAVAARQAVADAATVARAADAKARAAWKPLVGAVRSVAEEGETTFGGKSGKDLGPMPKVPTALDPAVSETLLAAPPPAPEFTRDRDSAGRAHRGNVLPTAIARLLGLDKAAA